ncbi:MAG: histidine kinase [Bacteroidia bacterium]|nr:histidine kinase [Bacteroidia bacterium]
MSRCFLQVFSIAIALFIVRGECRAQNYTVQHFTVKDGLADDEVFCFAEDTSGFIWIGTDNGLSRFDGKTFKNYFQEDGLAGRYITSLLQDSQHRLWAGAYREGLSVFENSGYQGCWRTKYRYDAGVDLLEYKGEFWEISGMSLRILRSGKMEVIKQAKNLVGPGLVPFYHNPPRANLAISPDSSAIWLGSYAGLVEHKAGRVRPLLPESEHPQLVSEILHLPDGSSLLGGSGIIRRYKDGHILRNYPLGLQDSFRVHRLVIVGDDVWAVVTGFGLISLNLSSGKITSLKDQYAIDDKVIHGLFADSQGNIWVGTRGNGVYCLQPTLLEKVPLHGQLCENLISGLEKLSTGELAIITRTGLSLRQTNGEITPLFCNSQMHIYGLLPHQDLPFVLCNNVTAPNGNLGQESQHIRASAAVELGKGKALQSEYLPYPKSENDPPHRLSLVIWEQSKWKKVHTYDLDFPTATSQIRTMLRDSIGCVWLGSVKGDLWRVDRIDLSPQSDTITQLHTKKIHLQDLQSGLVDQGGNVWICGTRHIWRLRPGSSEAEVVMSGKIFYQMALGASNTVWLATNEGLWSIKDDRQTAYTVNGYPELGQIEAMLVSEPEELIWLSSRDGLFILDISQLKTYQATIFPPQVLGITINGVQAESQSFITLRPGHDFRISLASPNFFAGIPTQFEYRINGAEWLNEPSGELKIPTSETGLQHLEVRSRIFTGKWSRPISLTYEIRPGLWQHPLTYLVMAMLLAGAAMLVARLQVKKVRRRERDRRQMQSRIYELENQALAAMLNPHFIFNTLNSIQQELLEDDPMLAHRHLSKFARLIRKNMDLAARPQVSLLEELERLQLYIEMEKLRLDNKIAFHLEEDPAIDAQKTQIPSMILQPFVENAVWHGILMIRQSGNVWIIVKKEKDGFLSLTIKDDGIGIEKARAMHQNSFHTSRGITLTEARIKHFHPHASVDVSQITTSDGQSAGTIVRILLPVKSPFIL